MNIQTILAESFFWRWKMDIHDKCDMCGRTLDEKVAETERYLIAGEYAYCGNCLGKILHHIAEQIGKVIKRG